MMQNHFITIHPHLYNYFNFMQKDDIPMPQTKETMTRRFYASEYAIVEPQKLKLLCEAIEDATAEVESGKHQEYYVVEVVRIVRKVCPEPIINVEVIEVR